MFVYFCVYVGVYSWAVVCADRCPEVGRSWRFFRSYLVNAVDEQEEEDEDASKKGLSNKAFDGGE